MSQFLGIRSPSAHQGQIQGSVNSPSVQRMKMLSASVTTVTVLSMSTTLSPACSSPSWPGGAPLLRVGRTQCLPLLSAPCQACVAAVAPLSLAGNTISVPLSLGDGPSFACPFAVHPGWALFPSPFGLLLLPDGCTLWPLHLTSLREASWHIHSGAFCK